MRRREFIAGLAGATAASPLWPLAARAQQQARMPRIGVFSYESENEVHFQEVREVFTARLHELGWIEGRNIHIDYRFADNDVGRLHTYAQELVALQPDVIFAPTSEAAAALRAATRTIPIVFAGGTDPVAKGLVESMARPGGNVTGFPNNAASIATKRLQLLKQIAPRIMQVALMYDPLLSSDALAFLAELEAAASSISVEVSGAAVRNPADIENALAALAARPGSGFVVYSGGSTFTYLDAIITEAAKQGIPAIYRDRHYVAAGGLASYGGDARDGHRGAATYVDRILRGAKPGDLPVQQPTKFQFVINLKTAKALGLTIPETLLATADEVIQ